MPPGQPTPSPTKNRQVILALDTTTPLLILGALSGTLETESSLSAGKAHAELLGPAVEGMLAKMSAPTIIAVGTGPGSYTGLRIGVSFALGLGKALGIPVAGISSLEAVAASREGLVAASLEARQGYVYGGIYKIENGFTAEVISPAKKWSAEDFQAHTAGIQRLHNQPPSGTAIARLASKKGDTELHLIYI